MTATVFTGNGVRVYQALALRQGIGLYHRTGMKPNSAWTPKNMLAAAGRITGKTYHARQYLQAMTDLTVWIDAQRGDLPVNVEA